MTQSRREKAYVVNGRVCAPSTVIGQNQMTDIDREKELEEERDREHPRADEIISVDTAQSEDRYAL